MENIGIGNFVVCGNYYNPDVVQNLYDFCGTYKEFSGMFMLRFFYVT